MKLTINLEGLTLPISKKLINLLDMHLSNRETKPSHTGFTFNFRDTSYSPDKGGYHPVEIGIGSYDGILKIDYITDFSFCAGPFPEIAIEFDFNCQENMLFSSYQKPIPLNDPEVLDFYQLWETNFISYVEMKCFDEIAISVYD